MRRLVLQLLLCSVSSAGGVPSSRAAPLAMYHLNSCTACERPKQGTPGSWCPCPDRNNSDCRGSVNLNCTSFAFDAAHLKAGALLPAMCQHIPSAAPVYCLKGTQDLWVGVPCPLPCKLPPPPPPPLPPLPPLPAVQPVWHLPSRCEEGDINALFQFNGVWHLMQQWHARPATSIGHAVSIDLLHWRRLPDVLSSGPTDDEQCYDGSSSLVQTDGGGVRPFLMIDGGCGRKAAGTSHCMESTGNGSTGGVTATPNDLSDLNLTNWTKRGPTVFYGCNGASGPSPIIKNPATGKAQLIAIYGRGEALFEATSDLTVWQLRNESFLPTRGGGGGLWHELPLNVQGSTGDRKFTHIMQLNDALGDGAATFAMLAVDEPSSSVLNLSPTVALDVGRVRYGQLSNSGGTGADGQTGDLRTIHVAWFVSAGWSTARCLPSDIHVGQLTSFRDLRFEPRIGPSGALVEMPIDEYRALRGDVVDSVAAKALKSSYNELLALPAGPSAIDIELNFTATTGSTTVSIGCSPDNLIDCGFHLSIAVEESTGSRSANVVMQIIGSDKKHPSPSATFPLFAGETEFSLRMMTDTRSIEVFACGGRGVYSGGFSTGYCANTTHCSLVASTSAPGVLVTGTAWHMNSIFE